MRFNTANQNGVRTCSELPQRITGSYPRPRDCVLRTTEGRVIFHETIDTNTGVVVVAIHRGAARRNEVLAGRRDVNIPGQLTSGEPPSIRACNSSHIAAAGITGICSGGDPVKRVSALINYGILSFHNTHTTGLLIGRSGWSKFENLKLPKRITV